MKPRLTDIRALRSIHVQVERAIPHYDVRAIASLDSQNRETVIDGLRRKGAQ